MVARSSAQRSVTKVSLIEGHRIAFSASTAIPEIAGAARCSHGMTQVA
jgi:hypothetical protein